MDIDYTDAIDILAHEYGWTIDYIQTLSLVEIDSLIKKINERKILEWTVECYIINCAFTGKNPKFNTDEKSNDKEISQAGFIQLMKKLGGKIEKQS